MESPIILFIQGVYKQDITSFIPPEDPKDSRENYDEFPAQFIDLGAWIKKTNLHCGHCFCKHSRVPVFIPNWFTGKNITIIKYLFCSFPCAAAFLNSTYSGDELHSKMQSLRYVYKIFTGKEIKYIPDAPLRSEITTFAGKKATYTPSQFQDLVSKIFPVDDYLI